MKKLSETRLSVAGKLVLITGAAQGNGKAVAHGLAEQGAKVVIVDIDGEGATKTAEAICGVGNQAWGFGLDVSDQEACERLAAVIVGEIGDIDVLINNAGILKRVVFESPAVSQALADTLAVNVTGPFNVTKAFLPSLKRTKGNVINVASIQSFVAATTSPTYAISKGAVAQMTRTLAAELAEFEIRVNAVAPGMFATAMSASTRGNENALSTFLQHVPMRRAADPDELVGPITFLASAAASYVTGVVLPVDGGYLVH
ncbi:SDR family NAD(P)-dependent oxidoreductase [Pseudomonas sp. NPDC089395]|uniref:SDR family NAD(P)-dependent oxidoreductase n=1 Tax=unclassified Pseudomonas TaxID=196821 RepID=UPI00300A9E10